MFPLGNKRTVSVVKKNKQKKTKNKVCSPLTPKKKVVIVCKWDIVNVVVLPHICKKHFFIKSEFNIG